MCYLPAVMIAFGVMACVLFGLYLTKDADCLMALFFMIIAWMATPEKDDDEED